MAPLPRIASRVRPATCTGAVEHCVLVYGDGIDAFVLDRLRVQAKRAIHKYFHDIVTVLIIIVCLWILYGG